jgi:hypothetical protein
MPNLDYKSAHRFVREQRSIGNNVRWDGWDMVFWKPTRYGFSSVDGAFYRGRWGIESRIPVDSNGVWKVPARNVKQPS